MRLPRFTLRRAMILVAVVAPGCYGWYLRERRNDRQRLALLHMVLSELFRDGHAETGRNPRLAAYHAELGVKYHRAARYPWLSVAADPPKPK